MGRVEDRHGLHDSGVRVVGRVVILPAAHRGGHDEIVLQGRDQVAADPDELRRALLAVGRRRLLVVIGGGHIEQYRLTGHRG